VGASESNYLNSFNAFRLARELPDLAVSILGSRKTTSVLKDTVAFASGDA
jgi:hypothetical protein